ncbi:MviM Predicted dehydrogenases and related proteins [Candidatus Methylopumilus universalis]|uniref:Gfo/Idh/MocA family protein n=1 Tax=Candidatus Methylopumilus universalis TaxID=2588536 RepID=UPI003BEF2693
MTNLYKIKIAVIGIGRMGLRHIQVIDKMDMDLVGIFDTNNQAMELAQTQFKLTSKQIFTNLEQLFNIAAPECLIIATTADFHCTLACMAAERGVKFILVEKPLAVSLDQCETMISTCKKFGARLSVNHQMRFLEQYSKPKEKLYSEAFGGFKSMTVIGGNIGASMNGTHYLEAFRYLSDEEPSEVSAWFDPDVVSNPRGIQFEDRSGSLRVVTASGKRLYMDISGDQGHGLQVIYSGRNGQVFINEITGEMIASIRKSEHRALPTTRYGMPDEFTREYISPVEVIDSTVKVLTALISGENIVEAQHGMSAIRTLVAAYTSSENGGSPIRLDAKLNTKLIFPWA